MGEFAITEAAWKGGTDFWELMRYVHHELNITERKKWLLTVAGARIFGEHIPRELEVILNELERFADQPSLYVKRWDSSECALDDLDRRALWVAGEMQEESGIGSPRYVAADAVYESLVSGLAGRVHSFSVARHLLELRRASQSTLVEYIREVFGNPFRPVALDLAWRTSDVMALANGIYAERAFDRLPILADALQDAGCDSDDILAHLRDEKATHVRGCWALDLVLGKE